MNNESIHLKKFESWMRPDGSKDDLFQLISTLPDNIKMVEIGSYSGESAEIFCSSNKIRQFTAIDPWKNGYDENDEASYLRPMEEVERVFDERMKMFSKCKKIKMTGNQAAIDFKNNSLDFVYIDGIHTYEGVKNDISIWLPKIKTNGFIGGHDYYLVNKAVDEMIGIPDKVFYNTSWIKQLKSVFLLSNKLGNFLIIK